MHKLFILWLINTFYLQVQSCRIYQKFKWCWNVAKVFRVRLQSISSKTVLAERNVNRRLNEAKVIR